MKRLLPIIALGFLLSPFSAKAEEWLYEWSGPALPNRHHPQWQVRGSGAFSIKEDQLEISTVDEQNLLVVTTLERSHGLWDASAPLLLEFRAEAVETSGAVGAAARLAVADGRNRYLISIEREGAHTYRMELKDGVASLSADGEAAPELLRTIALPQGDAFPNSLMFGDDFSDLAGTSLWHFIRWRPLE